MGMNNTAIINREEVINEAFYGKHFSLNAVVSQQCGYEMDGIWHSANSLLKADYRSVVSLLNDEELSDLLD